MMRRICILLTGLLTALAASAQVTYGQADSIKVCSLLQQARPDTPLLWFARQFLGVPYVAHTLEVNASEQLVVNTRQLDCTTLVETVAALALCAREGKSRWADYLGLLQRLRYRQGRLDGYPSRLHYFSDWIIDKTAMGLVEEVQKPNPPFTAVQKLAVNYMSRHPKSYRALAANPALLPAIRQQEKALTGRTFRYIPKSAVKNTRLLRQTIRDGDIIAITCNKKGLDIAHLGFAQWQADGLHLLNASMLHREVVVEPMTLGRYLEQHPSHTGIRVVRLK